MKLYPITAVMETIGLGRTTVFTLIREGKLRSVKVGRRRMVPAAALDEFIAALEEEQSDTPKEVA
ncbi:helix-turn-helix domain-containing protein [Corynebacterium glyciniphilum]|uniref:helix-turn-helix domain-containing protein n=1 Tax=Corynebacterium glyciniphilum TaxID=1404244 RepID=UPI002650C3BF|nr:helix-turn-helix domain-containing protein [Corynebacterium glyciniphilum]MDN6706755.1 helix-turn-helix domain-containing protein [Corynebacterium glyciniphilum]